MFCSTEGLPSPLWSTIRELCCTQIELSERLPFNPPFHTKRTPTHRRQPSRVTHTHTQNGDYHRASVSVPVSNRFLFITTFSCHLLQLFSRVPWCCFAVRLQKCFAWLQKTPKTLHPSFHLQLFLQTELGETASSCQTLHIHQSAPRRSNIQVMQQSEKKTHFCWEGDLKRLCSPAVMIYDILLSLIGAEPPLILIINHINASIVCLPPLFQTTSSIRGPSCHFVPPAHFSTHPDHLRTPPAVPSPARHAGYRHDFHHRLWQCGDHAAVQPHQHPLRPHRRGARQWQQLCPAVWAFAHQGPRRWVFA